jgi:hypothetical protein
LRDKSTVQVPVGCKTMKRVELLAELDSLTEEQIEAGLAEGIWEEPTRPLVQHYLYQVRQQRMERKVAEQIEIAREVSRSAVDRHRQQRTRRGTRPSAQPRQLSLQGEQCLLQWGPRLLRFLHYTNRQPSPCKLTYPRGPSIQGPLSLLLSPRHL